MNEKPYLETRVSFLALDKNNFLKYRKLSSFTVEEIIKQINAFEIALSAYKLDKSDKFFIFYNTYYQPLKFDVYCDLTKKDLLKYLEEIKSFLIDGKPVATIDLSILDDLYLHYKYNSFFQRDWFFRPQIEFSMEFYSDILSKQEELIFNHHFYDQDDKSPYHLPILEKLKTDDEFIIQPHYIDKKQAIVLLDSLLPPKNSIRKDEETLFKTLLIETINDKIILKISNNNY